MFQKGFAGIIILIVVLILAGLGGVYYLVKFQTPQSIISASPAPAAAAKNPVPDGTGETANWKTYTNSMNNYVVKIPKDWIIEDAQGVFLDIPGEVLLAAPNQKEKVPGRTVISIVAVKDQKIRYSLNTPEQFKDWSAREISNGKGERLYKIADVKLSAYNAVKFVSRTLPGDATEPFYSIVTWLNRDGVNYYVELGGDESFVEELRSNYDQILSTFKFLP